MKPHHVMVGLLIALAVFAVAMTIWWPPAQSFEWVIAVAATAAPLIGAWAIVAIRGT